MDFPEIDDVHWRKHILFLRRNDGTIEMGHGS
jgi:hypothetical protein